MCPTVPSCIVFHRMFLLGIFNSALIFPRAVTFCQFYPSRGCQERVRENVLRDRYAAKRRDILYGLPFRTRTAHSSKHACFVYLHLSIPHIIRLHYGALHLNVPRASVTCSMAPALGWLCMLAVRSNLAPRVSATDVYLAVDCYTRSKIAVYGKSKFCIVG